jgi:hypothetical protein
MSGWDRSMPQIFSALRVDACFEIIFGSGWLRQPIQKIQAHFLYRLQLSAYTKNE